jgi:hypothetical protein
MPDKSDSKRGKIQLQPFLKDFRSAMPDQELMKKHNLSAQTFVSLIKALVAQNIITHVDLSNRKEVAVRRDLQKESQFLAGLFICPSCGHPHPQRFELCPACGEKPEDFAQAQDVLHEDTLSDGEIDVEDDDFEPPSDEDLAQTTLEIETATHEPPPTEKAKGSALGSVRSLLSRGLKKK